MHWNFINRISWEYMSTSCGDVVDMICMVCLFNSNSLCNQQTIQPAQVTPLTNNDSAESARSSSIDGINNRCQRSRTISSGVLHATSSERSESCKCFLDSLWTERVLQLMTQSNHSWGTEILYMQPWIENNVLLWEVVSARTFYRAVYLACRLSGYFHA